MHRYTKTSKCSLMRTVTRRRASAALAETLAAADYNCSFRYSFTLHGGIWRLAAVPKQSVHDRNRGTVHTCKVAANRACSRNHLGFSGPVIRHLGVADTAAASSLNGGNIKVIGSTLLQPLGGAASYRVLSHEVHRKRKELTHAPNFTCVLRRRYLFCFALGGTPTCFCCITVPLLRHCLSPT